MIDAIKESLTKKGYRLFTRPFELNIVGVRTGTPVTNAFDDTINVFFLDNTGQWNFHSWEATTHPGAYWLEHPMNATGAAILKPGQYIDSHAHGLHRGKYFALVQQKPVTVIRDANNDSVLNYSAKTEETGLFGINIHRALQEGTTKVVDKFSAGCQVFANAGDFSSFLQLVEKHKAVYGNHFTYTLLNSTDLSLVSIVGEQLKKNQ